jgi:hypothetical protein
MRKQNGAQRGKARQLCHCISTRAKPPDPVEWLILAIALEDPDPNDCGGAFTVFS